MIKHPHLTSGLHLMRIRRNIFHIWDLLQREHSFAVRDSFPYDVEGTVGKCLHIYAKTKNDILQ